MPWADGTASACCLVKRSWRGYFRTARGPNVAIVPCLAFSAESTETRRNRCVQSKDRPKSSPKSCFQSELADTAVHSLSKNSKRGHFPPLKQRVNRILENTSIARKATRRACWYVLRKTILNLLYNYLISYSVFACSFYFIFMLWCMYKIILIRILESLLNENSWQRADSSVDHSILSTARWMCAHDEIGTLCWNCIRGKRKTRVHVEFSLQSYPWKETTSTNRT